MITNKKSFIINRILLRPRNLKLHHLFKFRQNLLGYYYLKKYLIAKI